MKKELFDLVSSDLLNDCLETLQSKCGEYSEHDDRLSAFKLNWLSENKLNCNQVLWGMMVKHLNSIYTMINNNELDLIKWHEKITDSICYLCLLWGLIYEQNHNN